MQSFDSTSSRKVSDFSWDPRRSSISFCQVAKNSDAVDKIEKIDTQKPTLLCLGGEYVTYMAAAVDAYLYDLRDILKQNNLEDKVNLYGGIYNYGEETAKERFGMDPKLARHLLFYDYKHITKKPDHLNPLPDDREPQYVAQLYELFIAPKIQDQAGKRLSLEQAKKNMRNLIIFSHCHGGYTAFKLEELTQKKMAQLGYKETERSDIQKQLLNIAQAPYCPLGISKSTLISFCAASDYVVNHHNCFQAMAHVLAAEKTLPFAYFEGKKGDLFLIPETTGSIPTSPHFFGLEKKDGMPYFLDLSIRMSVNALLKAINNVTGENKDLPDIKNLICDSKKDLLEFEKAKYNGEQLWQEILQAGRQTASYRKPSAFTKFMDDKPLR